MTNIKYIKLDTYKFLGFSVFQDNIGFDLKLSDNANNIDRIYFDTFRLLVLNECKSDSDSCLLLDPKQIVDCYTLRETPLSDFKQLLSDYGFPNENLTRRPYVCLEGSFSSNNSKWKILYPKSISTLGIIDGLLLKREGLILYYPNSTEIYGSTNLYEFLLHKKVEDVNEKWKNSTQKEKYQFLEELQVVAEQAGAKLEEHYSNLKIMSPEKIVPDIIQTDNGFKVISGISEDIIQEDFNKHVENRIIADDIYTIKNKNNEDVKVLISKEQKEVLSDIKKLSNASKDEIKEFLKNPPENWNDEIVDVSNLYSDRVIGWELYTPGFNFNESKYNNNWFENADIVSDEDALDLESHDSEIKQMKNLLIKDNEEDVDYSLKAEQLLKTYEFPEIPGGYRSPYYPKQYQKEGIAWLYTTYKNENPGCILADDMGLGKTFQILSFLQSISKENKNVLLVAPTSLLNNWEDEYYKFFNDINYQIYICRTNRADISRLLQQQINGEENRHSSLYIASYESIRSFDAYIKIYWDVVILDEAQKIKNPLTLTNKTARALKSSFNIAVTGTPVENTFSDIWAISDFACPGYLGSHKDFKNEFNYTSENSDVELVQKGKKIREKLGMLLLRRLKEDNLPELPSKEYIRVENEMPDLQKKVYKQVLALSVNPESQVKPLHIIQLLKQVSDHYSFIKKYDTLNYSYEDTAKTIELIEILKKVREEDEKAIVFAEYIHTQDILAKVIDTVFNIRPQIFNGTINITARDNILRRFKKSEGFNVIIMSPIAAGVGLNIVEANHVIHYSRHWNPAKEDQATDRVYRIGQKKTVFVYTLIGKIYGLTTFDEKLDSLLSKKQAVKSAALYPSAKLDIDKNELFDVLQNF